MLPIKVALHIFVSVLILGTVWRLGSYHAMASKNPHVKHIGAAMNIQY